MKFAKTKIFMRLIVAAIIIIALVSMGIYNYFNFEDYYAELKTRTNWNIGGLVISEINARSFKAATTRDTVIALNYRDVFPKWDELTVGSSVSIKSLHLNGDTVNVQEMYIHKGREWKIGLSLIPLFLWLYIFVKYFRFDRKQFRVIKRNA